MKTAQERLAEFLDVCRKVGLKATHQRTEIYRELAATQEHPDAETVYSRVRERVPTISLDTVYRTLRVLEEKGVISRVGFLGDRTRFDANTDQHHHFVCTQCGRIGDFASETLNNFVTPPEVTSLGTVDSVYVELRGRCRKCQQGAKKPEKRRDVRCKQ